MAGHFEYLLVASPDAAVMEQVIAEKDFFSAHFNKRIAARTKPHITIANFMAAEEMEPAVIRYMHRVISAHTSFKVTLDQYGAFRPHTIYIRVQDHQPFHELARGLKAVDQFMQGYGCAKMKLVDHPHMTVARRLDPITYRDAISVYAQKTFNASFEVKELLLLKRRDQFDACRMVNVFGMKSM